MGCQMIKLSKMGSSAFSCVSYLPTSPQLASFQRASSRFAPYPKMPAYELSSRAVFLAKDGGKHQPRRRGFSSNLCASRATNHGPVAPRRADHNTVLMMETSAQTEGPRCAAPSAVCVKVDGRCVPPDAAPAAAAPEEPPASFDRQVFAEAVRAARVPFCSARRGRHAVEAPVADAGAWEWWRFCEEW